MITRNGEDEFHVSTFDITLSFEKLKQHLNQHAQIWSEEQLLGLRDLDIGDSTPAPYAVYR